MNKTGCLNISYDLFVMYTTNSPHSIRFIQNPSEEICMDAVQQNGSVIRYISAPYQTRNVCIAAIQNHPFALEWIVHQTEELCLLAVSIFGKSILVVRTITPKIFETARKQDSFVQQLLDRGDIRITSQPKN